MCDHYMSQMNYSFKPNLLFNSHSALRSPSHSPPHLNHQFNHQSYLINNEDSQHLQSPFYQTYDRPIASEGKGVQFNKNLQVDVSQTKSDDFNSMQINRRDRTSRRNQKQDFEHGLIICQNATDQQQDRQTGRKKEGRVKKLKVYDMPLGQNSNDEGLINWTNQSEDNDQRVEDIIERNKILSPAKEIIFDQFKAQINTPHSDFYFTSRDSKVIRGPSDLLHPQSAENSKVLSSFKKHQVRDIDLDCQKHKQIETIKPLETANLKLQFVSPEQSLGGVSKFNLPQQEEFAIFQRNGRVDNVTFLNKSPLLETKSRDQNQMRERSEQKEIEVKDELNRSRFKNRDSQSKEESIQSEKVGQQVQSNQSKKQDRTQRKSQILVHNRLRQIVGDENQTDEVFFLKIEDDPHLKTEWSAHTDQIRSPEASSEHYYKLIQKTDDQSIDDRNKKYLNGYLTGSKTKEKLKTRSSKKKNIQNQLSKLFKLESLWERHEVQAEERMDTDMVQMEGRIGQSEQQSELMTPDKMLSEYHKKKEKILKLKIKSNLTNNPKALSQKDVLRKQKVNSDEKEAGKALDVGLDSLRMFTEIGLDQQEDDENIPIISAKDTKQNPTESSRHIPSQRQNVTSVTSQLKSASHYLKKSFKKQINPEGTRKQNGSKASVSFGDKQTLNTFLSKLTVNPISQPKLPTQADLAKASQEDHVQETQKRSKSRAGPVRTALEPHSVRTQTHSRLSEPKSSSNIQNTTGTHQGSTEGSLSQVNLMKSRSGLKIQFGLRSQQNLLRKIDNSNFVSADQIINKHKPIDKSQNENTLEIIDEKPVIISDQVHSDIPKDQLLSAERVSKKIQTKPQKPTVQTHQRKSSGLLNTLQPFSHTRISSNKQGKDGEYQTKQTYNQRVAISNNEYLKAKTLTLQNDDLQSPRANSQLRHRNEEGQNTKESGKTMRGKDSSHGKQFSEGVTKSGKRKGSETKRPYILNEIDNFQAKINSFEVTSHLRLNQKERISLRPSKTRNDSKAPSQVNQTMPSDSNIKLSPKVINPQILPHSTGNRNSYCVKSKLMTQKEVFEASQSEYKVLNSNKGKKPQSLLFERKKLSQSVLSRGEEKEEQLRKSQSEKKEGSKKDEELEVSRFEEVKGEDNEDLQTMITQPNLANVKSTSYLASLHIYQDGQRDSLRDAGKSQVTSALNSHKKQVDSQVVPSLPPGNKYAASLPSAHQNQRKPDKKWTEIASTSQTNGKRITSVTRKPTGQGLLQSGMAQVSKRTDYDTSIKQLNKSLASKQKVQISTALSSTNEKTKTTPKNMSSMLLDSEKEKFGDRCPKGYQKIGLLGKGGIAVVWLALVKNSKVCGLDSSLQGTQVALKQFPKSKTYPIDPSARVEVELGSILFPLQVRDGCEGLDDSEFQRTYAIDPESHPGMKSISRLIDLVEDRNDVWLVYEVGSLPLGKYLTEVKGEFFRGERIYNVAHQEFYEALLGDKRILATLIRKVAETFDVLARFGIVHSDIKPDNILVKMNEECGDIEEIKLIDFGSAFQFDNVTQISATTPEYLAPEILHYLEERNRSSKSDIQTAIQLNKISQPWSFDVWSLGVILLEIITGFPVWMSLKCRASTVNGKSVMGTGIFGVQGREGKKILLKQQQLLRNLPQTLKKYECYGLNQDMEFMDLLSRMLDFDPRTRISPFEIIQSPFCMQFA